MDSWWMPGRLLSLATYLAGQAAQFENETFLCHAQRPIIAGKEAHVLRLRHLIWLSSIGRSPEEMGPFPSILNVITLKNEGDFLLALSLFAGLPSPWPEPVKRWICQTSSSIPSMISTCYVLWLIRSRPTSTKMLASKIDRMKDQQASWMVCPGTITLAC